MLYKHKEIEKKWQKYWAEQNIYKVKENPKKPKYYVLDMFPYPSGAGLHVGHPLGYIASDIISRYKRLKGYEVLHPMGFDSFGLPAEQHAIEHNIHPAITTEKNINTYKKQLKKLGLSYDWSREVNTSNPNYYKWTQWIFSQLFLHWYDKKTDKSRSISELIAVFEKEGNQNIQAACSENLPLFDAKSWLKMSVKEQQEILLGYRLTYLSEEYVNWCPALGTVLANDDIKDGVSERGEHPIEKRKIKQWMMRVTAFADRLDKNLTKLNWSNAMKEMQRNWIGKSFGLNLKFKVQNQNIELITFTTRPDTIFGVTYLVMAPEHKLVPHLTSLAQKKDVENYVSKVKKRSERQRLSEKTISGIFTGIYVTNPFNGKLVPLWLADYVLENYGTGVIMAVPSSDDRDFRFAKHFDLPIKCIIEGTENLDNPCIKKQGKMINSDFLNGLSTKKAIQIIIQKAKNKGLGKATINYKMRDAIFARQRYWGEPVPIYYDENNLPQLIDEKDLPLKLPHLENFKPTGDLAGPLSRVKNWKYKNKYPLEINTMPVWAGSSWYSLRYMDPDNNKNFAAFEKINYWKQVDLYIGGTEHATSHLLYSRFWNLFLYDIGKIPFQEPFKHLFNQGMIQGNSAFIYKIKNQNRFVSYNIKEELEKNLKTAVMRVDIALVKDNKLNIEKFKKWRPEHEEAIFESDKNGNFYCQRLVEKMSKSKYNVVNPDAVITEYGTDSLRLYEMFLGPISQNKPWNTESIEGVVKFLKKLWSLFFDDSGNLQISDNKPTPDMLTILHQTLKKIEDDLERLSINTCVSTFMICVNDLKKLNCTNYSILKDLLIALAPFAPHIVEELWSKLGHVQSIHLAQFPKWEAKYFEKKTVKYVVSVNGKKRALVELKKELSSKEIEEEVKSSVDLEKWINNRTIRKVIVVPNKLVNFVVN